MIQARLPTEIWYFLVKSSSQWPLAFQWLQSYSNFYPHVCNRLATRLPQSGGTASRQELDSLAPNQWRQDPGGWDSDSQGASGQRKGCLADPTIRIHCTREGNSQCSANLTMILRPLCNCHIAVPLISLSSTCITISPSIALQLAGKLVVYSTVCTDLAKNQF